LENPENRKEKLNVAGSQSRANVTKMPRFSFGQLLRANEQQQSQQQKQQQQQQQQQQKKQQ